MMMAVQGGKQPNPDYENIKDHQECIEVTYVGGPATYERLLGVCGASQGPRNSGEGLADSDPNEGGWPMVCVRVGVWAGRTYDFVDIGHR